MVGTRQDGRELQYVTLHGHRHAFLRAGSGPVLLLLHGMGCDHTTWDPLVDALARRYTVIAPDLLGHGASDKPRSDYSLGAFANEMRDLLSALDVDRATIVGHSYGGGVAMQFAYQFPERTERIVLIASGGLGREVTLGLRAVALPGAEQMLGLVTLPGVRHTNQLVLRSLARLPHPLTRDLGEIAALSQSLSDRRARRAFTRLVRGVIDVRGQVVSMADRAYLAAAVPVCVLWGAEDLVLPARHLDRVGELMPHADVHLLPNAGHFPHVDHPLRVTKIIRDFVRRTEPADPAAATALLRGHGGPETAQAPDLVVPMSSA